MRELLSGHTTQLQPKLPKQQSDPLTPMLVAVGCALLLPSLTGVTLLVSGGSVISTGTVWEATQSMSIAIFLAVLSTAALKFAWKSLDLQFSNISEYLPARWIRRRRDTRANKRLVAFVESQLVLDSTLLQISLSVERMPTLLSPRATRESDLVYAILDKLGFSEKEKQIGRLSAMLQGQVSLEDDSNETITPASFKAVAAVTSLAHRYMELLSAKGSEALIWKKEVFSELMRLSDRGYHDRALVETLIEMETGLSKSIGPRHFLPEAFTSVAHQGSRREQELEHLRKLE